MSKKPLGGRCGDTTTAMGVRNQGARDWYMEMPAGTDPEPCSETTTHYLKGQPLCLKHWKQGLEARDQADARVASYHRQLRNYQR